DRDPLARVRASLTPGAETDRRNASIRAAEANGAHERSGYNSSIRNAPPLHVRRNCAIALDALFFCALRASAKPKSDRGLLGLRSRSAPNTFSASAGCPMRSKAAPRGSRTG